MPSTILYMQGRGCGPCRLKALTNNPAVADDWIGLDKTTLVQSPTLYNYNKPPSYNNARFTAFRFSSSLSSQGHLHHQKRSMQTKTLDFTLHPQRLGTMDDAFKVRSLFFSRSVSIAMVEFP